MVRRRAAADRRALGIDDPRLTGSSMGAGQALRRVARALQPLVPRTGDGVRVLAYHLVGGGTASPVDVGRSRFLGQMEEIRESCHVAPLRTALAGLAEDRLASGPMVVVTFDDAFRNFIETALPILDDLEIPATLYVPVGFVDGVTPSPLAGADLPASSWEELREIAAHPMVDIGSHTCSHSTLTQLDVDAAAREIRESRQRLEQELQVEVDSFCYPRGKWSRSLERVVAGNYASAAIGGGRALVPARYSPYRLTRFPIRRDMPVSLAPVLRHRALLEEVLANAIRCRTR